MFKYNTQEKKLPLPEYGRSVQNMVNHAVMLADRAERQRCANTIISIMGNMFPQYRDLPEFRHKLWDHLAIMSDFQLDIDYPYEVIRPEALNPKPDPIPIPVKQVRYRHYGHTLIALIEKAVQMEESPEKENFTALIGNYMRRCQQNWNKGNVEDQVLDKDLQMLSDGQLSLTPAILRIMSERMEYYGGKDKNPSNRQGGKDQKQRNKQSKKQNNNR